MSLETMFMQAGAATEPLRFRNLPRYDYAEFLGIGVHAMTVHDLTKAVRAAIVSQQKWAIANHNLHSLYLCHTNLALRRFFRKARFTHIDGMSMVALARLYGYSFDRDHRTGYTDWLPLLMPAAVEAQWKVFYLGSAPKVVNAGASQLRRSYPGLVLEARHGYFDTRQESAENETVLQQIRDFAPHILMVGMGMPRQELWIEENMEAIKANVILACGAALDYVAGEIPTPPRWMGRMGLEWAFRLASEPRRLASRYLIEPWTIVKLLLEDALGRRGSDAVWSPYDSRVDGDAVMIQKVGMQP